MGAKAQDRTISFLTGQTNQEQSDEAERVKQGLDLLSKEQRVYADPTIESNADRYRANAFSGQEFVSKHFGDPTSTSNEYRISTKNGICYLERTASGLGTKGAYSYAGVMFPEGDLPVLARVAVDAAKAYIARNK